jgi:cysteine-rich repeat protein
MGQCGNGALDAGEECDDGGTFPWDGCSDTCEVNFLSIAIETSGSCLATNQSSLVTVQTLLEARGHTVTIVDGSALDTAAEIGAYDVVYLGGWTSNCQQGVSDLGLFDAQINAYLAAGGGLSTGGWTQWTGYLAAPNIEAALPQTIGELYVAGPVPVMPVGAHPIVTGILSFEALDYVPYGSGAKAGAEVLLTSGGQTVGSAWTVQTNGRASWLGPLFNESYNDYLNENLTDGSQPQAIELLMRTIEWTGGWY